MLDSLSREERLHLMKFICSFAWADLRVRDEEREFITSMVDRLRLDPEETAQVREWMEVPPPADELDPSLIPAAHRKLFLDAARAMVLADGKVERAEAENIALLEQLML